MKFIISITIFIIVNWTVAMAQFKAPVLTVKNLDRQEVNHQITDARIHDKFLDLLQRHFDGL